MYKYLLIIFIVLIILALAFFFFFLRKEGNLRDLLDPSPIPISSTGLGNLNVESINPQDKAINISIYQEISINFSGNLTSVQQNQVKFSSTPAFNFEQEWLNSGKTLVIKPSPMATGTSYNLRLDYPPKSHQWSISTIAAENLSGEDLSKVQLQADKNWADYWSRIDKEYPWYTKLPIKSSGYFVYFDLEKEKVVGVLYPKKGSPSSIDSQVNDFKKEIMDKLGFLNIPVKETEVEWIIEPKP